MKSPTHPSAKRRAKDKCYREARLYLGHPSILAIMVQTEKAGKKAKADASRHDHLGGGMTFGGSMTIEGRHKGEQGRHGGEQGRHGGTAPTNWGWLTKPVFILVILSSWQSWFRQRIPVPTEGIPVFGCQKQETRNPA